MAEPGAEGIGDIQNYLADFNPKDPVISKSEPILDTVEEEDEDDTDLNLGSAAAGSAGQYFVDQATGQYYFQSSNGDMVQLEDTADTGAGGGGILDQEEDVPYKR